ncbi:MAG: fibronectin type III domain-containing protein, partial [Spirochaetaceae bacterium]|nr:fibronectin type III domain-containing protein [Spirochaetaceae bacterium]
MGKRILKTLVFSCFVFFISQNSTAQAGRTPWDEVAAPVIVSIEPGAADPEKVAVNFTLAMGSDGADRAQVDMMDASGRVIKSNTVGRSSRQIKRSEFSPSTSGTYSFRVTASRTDTDGVKTSDTVSFSFSYPLAPPNVTVMNEGNGAVSVSWNAVKEAENYALSYKDTASSGQATVITVSNLSHLLTGLTVGHKYTITVTAKRGSGGTASDPVIKTVRSEQEREWNFTWFGQSTNGDRNRFEMIDADNMKFRLFSATHLPDGTIVEKGGKFTAFHDGVSFYYTVIDPKTENFELTATFTIDYINPVADGQEGFGLIAMDSLGQYGVSSVNHYTNSAGIIATKFEETIAGVKKTSKDTLGSRFVTGLTPEVIALGDAGIAQHGLSVSRAYSYDQSDLIKTGDVYTITLKKTNTGYYAIFPKEITSEDTITEFILYDGTKLQQLDPDHVYIGFVVARGCNATVSDVVFKVTDSRTDPPAEKEPPELVPLITVIDSPTTYYTNKYPFTFYANADGVLNVTDKNGKTVLKNKQIKAFKDFTAKIKIARGMNDLVVIFTPDPKYKPGENMVMASYDRYLRRYVESYTPVSLSHSIIYTEYAGKELYVTPSGSAFGKGTREEPLDLTTALYYLKPGQTIIMAEGRYYPTGRIIIERGNSGTKSKPKVIQAEAGKRVVIDFSATNSGGIIHWGDYWIFDGIDICNTFGDFKGFQVAGSYNIVRNVNTYNNGDTGLQISGVSTEPWEKWPGHNLILNCTSYNNCDPAENNADGFAAKLTCGDGNIFRGCIAYSNIDDGWDLFAKIETGPIGAVLIENCIAYKNGTRSDGTG